MSPRWVENRSAPRTVFRRFTGTATKTITSPRSLTRTVEALCPASASATS
jgi:hypothetical protein